MAPRENMNREPVRRNVTVETIETKALVAQDGLGYDWSDQAEDGPTNFALMAYTSLGSSSSSSSDSEVLIKQEARLDVYKKNEIVFEEDIKILKLDINWRDNALTELRKKFKKAEKERDNLKLTLEKFGNSSKNLSKLQENDRYKINKGYHVVPLPYTGNFIPPIYDLVLADKGEYVFSESITSIPDVATSEAKTSVSKPKSVGEPIIEDWISDSEDANETEFKSKQRKPSFTKIEFVKSNEHLKTTSESVKKNDSPHPKGNFVPKAVLMKSGIKTLNTIGQNFSKAAVSVNTARPINTAYPRPTVNSARTTSNVFNRTHTHVRRPFNKSITNKNSNLKEQVNTVKGNVTTAGPKAAVSDHKGNKANAVKASACWVRRPKQKVLDHVSRHNGALMNFKRFYYVDAQGRSKSIMAWVLKRA
ncbi:hypothetical protein Tco_1410016 [Tanacetum coccineum]